MVKSSAFSFCLFALAAFFVTGCGGKQVKSDITDQLGDSLFVVEERAEYKLGFGDLIEIKFFYNSELNQELVVRPDGRVTLPRLGDIYVVGHTPSMVDEVITSKYAEVIRDPDITVIVKSFASQVVYVLGEVNMPGGYDLQVDMKTLQAIALAGGFTRNAKLSSVILIRSAGGIAQAERVNLGKIIDSGSLEGDGLLKPYDVVYVPNHFIDKVDLFMENYFEGLLPPFNLYLRGYDVAHPRQSIRTR
jgi:protein involved in polysaccharide export with SLBB domain